MVLRADAILGQSAILLSKRGRCDTILLYKDKYRHPLHHPPSHPASLRATLYRGYYRTDLPPSSVLSAGVTIGQTIHSRPPLILPVCTRTERDSLYILAV